MADLLAHVLLAYVLFTVAGWRFDAVTDRWVAVAMGGAALPDLVKVNLVLSRQAVEAVLGVPFTYQPLSTLGGVALTAGVVALLFGGEYRRRAYAFLLAGGVTSLVVDGFRITLDGRAGSLLYPVTWWEPPSPNLYLTSDPRVLVVAVALAFVVYGFDRYRSRPAESGEGVAASEEATE
jgi:hypothetical protein